MSDLVYSVSAVRNQYCFAAARYCVEAVLVSRWVARYMPTVSSVQKSQDSLRNLWRARLSALVDHGWAVDKRTLGYYRNCPPTGCQTDAVARVCKRFFCPFCYSRQVVGVYKKLCKALIIGWEGGKPIWGSYRLVVLKDREIVPAVNSFDEMRSSMERKRSGRFKGIQCEGYYQRYTLEPYSRELAYRISRQSVLVLNPGQDLHLPHPETIRIDYDNLGFKTLVNVVRQVCPYPQGWMRDSPQEMVQLIEAFRLFRWSSTQGILRNSHNRKCKRSIDG